LLDIDDAETPIEEDNQPHEAVKTDDQQINELAGKIELKDGELKDDPLTA